MPYRRQMTELQEISHSIGEQLNSAFKPFQQWIIRNSSVIEGFRKAIEEWPERQREAIVTIAKHGWFLDRDMPLGVPTEFARALDERHVEEVTEVITEYFRKNIDEIEKRLEKHCPRRMCVLREAFDAHREGKYSLSIPVFLSQADGIWWDEFSESVFQVQGRSRAAQDYIEENRSDYFTAFFDIFEEQVPLWVSASERSQSFDQLNRHLVLHGEAVDYGSEENSLKAISFLNWLCWMLDWHNEKAA